MKIFSRKNIIVISTFSVIVTPQQENRSISLFVTAFSSSSPPQPPTKRTTNTGSTNIKNNDQQRQQQLETLSQKLDKCKSGTLARQIISQTFPLSISTENNDNTKIPLYNSISIPKGASVLSISDAELAIQTNIRNNKYPIMDLIELNGDKDIDRASLALLSIFIGSTLSAIAIQNSIYIHNILPDIIIFVIVWIISFFPLIFVGLGLSIPNELYSTLIYIQSSFFPLYKQRMIHHEAGHFLIGYLVGMPIKGYKTNNVVKNAVEFYPLRDDDVGKNKASLLGFDSNNNSNGSVNNDEYSNYDNNGNVGYFEKGGRGEDITSAQSVFRNKKDYANNPFLKISNENDVKQSWPYRGFDHGTIDKLAIVSVAGVCSEILSFGNAEGGLADLNQLRQILINAEPALNEREMENVIKYSIGYTMGQLRRYLGALDSLIEVMERDGSVAECIMAIENCDNVSGATVMGSYEKVRREEIQSKGLGFVERLFLGEKNADTEDKSVIYGKGGGDRKKGFQLTGDDPFYAALATAAFFLVWASSGGLTLH